MIIKEFAGEIFEEIRRTSVIREEYLSSWCNHSIQSIKSTGKSGASFLYSIDKKFIIKTLTKYELKTFLKILSAYFNVCFLSPFLLSYPPFPILPSLPQFPFLPPLSLPPSPFPILPFPSSLSLPPFLSLLPFLPPLFLSSPSLLTSGEEGLTLLYFSGREGGGIKGGCHGDKKRK